jgi:NADPH-dependent 2,4-dienoyl-CoA reductase/sulfur reductase-like enzyme
MAGLYFDYVVVGASRAGLSCAEAVRAGDGSGSILLISREKYLPYKRTKLSKKLCLDYGPDDFILHDAEWYREQRISLYLDAEAVDLAPEICTLFLADGRKVGYGRLCIATGAAPLALPDTEGENILYLREKSDGCTIFREAAAWRRVAVVGTGIQGIEMAEQFRILEKETDLIGLKTPLMHGKIDAAMSMLIEGLLEKQGIGRRRMTGIDVKTLSKEYDGIVASIGVTPAADWLRGKLDARRGIVIDSFGRTSLPDIYAAGDVTEPLLPFTSGLWHGAEYQGMIAGRAMTGNEARMEPLPFRMKLDLFGKHFYALWYDPVLETDPGVESTVLAALPGIDYCRVLTRKGSVVSVLYSGNPRAGKEIIKPAVKEKAGGSVLIRRLESFQE